jgi:hypothetical protein
MKDKGEVIPLPLLHGGRFRRPRTERRTPALPVSTPPARKSARDDSPAVFGESTPAKDGSKVRPSKALGDNT